MLLGTCSNMAGRAGRRASRWLRVTTVIASAIALVTAPAGCSTSGTADLTSGGELWDGKSLSGWRRLSGSWSAVEGALLGVGPRSRLLRKTRCPDAYRLRFVSWRAIPVEILEAVL